MSEGSRKPLPGPGVAMHQTDFGRLMAHPGHEAHEVVLVCVRGIPRNHVDTRTDDNTLAIEIHIAAARAITLDVGTRCH